MQGGKSFNDRELAARVRSLALEEIEKILKNKAKNKTLYQAVIVRLAGSVLPRLNEHTGDEGGPLVVQITKEASDKYATDSSTSDHTQG